MNIVDLIIFIIVVIGFILGFKDGFIRKLIGFIGFIAAIFLAIKYSSQLGKILENTFAIEYYLSELIAGVIIFVGIIIIFVILKRVVHPYDKVNNLVNQLVGGFMGMIQILFFLSAALYILNIFNVPSNNSKKSSLVYKPVYNIIPASIDLVSRYTPDAKNRIKDYINDKDTLK